MSAETKEPVPLKVQIVETKRAAQHIVGAPASYVPVVATRDTPPECILQYSERRKRAVISVVGTGVVAFGTNPNNMINGVGSRAGGAQVQGPVTFELQSTNDWYVSLVSGANTTVNVIAETEVDV